MKIGQIMIEVYFDPETGIHLTTSPEEVQQGTHTGNVEKSKSPDEVQLDPDSDTFAEDKAKLKADGYFFNRSSKTWRKKKGSAPATANGTQTQATQQAAQASSATNIQADWFGDATEIELSQDNPDFDSKKEALKAAGFRWNPKAKAWRQPDQ